MKYFYMASPDGLVSKMYEDWGWKQTDNLEYADIIQFNGGTDVSPYLYGEDRHPRTYCNPERDKKEKALFDLSVLLLKKPMAGICRGSQFLNVMCGGKLWQDVDNHAIGGTHKAWVSDIDLQEHYHIDVTSTHHQMHRIANAGIIRGSAWLCTFKEHMEDGYRIRHTELNDMGPDIEAFYYPEQRVFAVQGHPEYMSPDSDFQKYYFRNLDKLLKA